MLLLPGEAEGEAMFTPHRLLVWDHFKCHVGKDTKECLKKLEVDQVVTPGGCTCFTQAPDVCWNKPLKDSHIKNHTITGLRPESKNLQQQAIINLHLWR